MDHHGYTPFGDAWTPTGPWLGLGHPPRRKKVEAVKTTVFGPTAAETTASKHLAILLLENQAFGEFHVFDNPT